MNSKDEVDCEHPQNENEKWIYLTIRDTKGDNYDLGKVYLSESIKSIIQKFKKMLEMHNCNYYVILSYLGKGINRRGTLADILPLNRLEEMNNEEFLFHGEVRVKGGGCSVAFIDVENAQVKKLNFEKGPKYKEVTRGLNFFGICGCKLCNAKDKKVYMQFGMGTFNYSELINERKFKCPICESNIYPDGCGFWDCEYEIKGKGIKKGEDKLRTFSRKGIAESEHFERFDPATDLEDKVDYIELIFTVCYRGEND